MLLVMMLFFILVVAVLMERDGIIQYRGEEHQPEAEHQERGTNILDAPEAQEEPN